MNVTPASPVVPTNAPSASTPSGASATGGLDYNSFLTLLMAEMKNQDPTQPMDPSQMVTQLATISNVGQAVQTNTTLNSLLTAASLSQADQLIGKTVTASDGTTGQVSSVTIAAAGSTATLSDGSQIPLGNGLSVSGQ